MTNPFQDVIDWLRSEEGEQWSEKRLRDARYVGVTTAGVMVYNPTPTSFSVPSIRHGDGGVPGMFSFKQQVYDGE